ncbi:unnamed protein product [Dovyalis caffra]|uniref:Uncharacterized protein n=1 Tax=Dovyalis caffra TaxID=77055 RepID=A0AAV1RYZ7_9ROSI|nr:unnamed protein product [Dovyalis caffra]
MQGKPGGPRRFGAAKQVPKKLSALDELEFDGFDISPLRPFVDSERNAYKVFPDQFPPRKDILNYDSEHVYLYDTRRIGGREPGIWMLVILMLRRLGWNVGFFNDTAMRPE